MQICWNSNLLKTTWEDRLRNISKTVRDAEYEMVKRGLRKVDVFHMTPANFDKEIDKITRDGLIYLPIIRSRQYQGYSHQHYPVEQLDMNCMVYGVVAKDVGTAQEFIDAEKNRNYIKQGELLGYPVCCSSRFSVLWQKEKILDPCFEVAAATKGATITDNTVTVAGHYYLNILLRYFGIKIIPFFPCSMDCAEAIKTGDKWIELFRDMNNQVADDLTFLLQLPLSWNLYKGYSYIETPLFRGVVNSYECPQKKIIWNVNGGKKE